MGTATNDSNVRDGPTLWHGSALVGLAGLAVYGLLCPPASGMGDSSEFTLVLATHGVAHPTGYPLYTLFGHLFCTLLHGVGTPWPLAAALWSAVGGGLALFFLHALGTALIDEASPRSPATRFLAALIPLSLFAFQPIVLGEATRAEVNIWSLAWACGAALAFVRLAGAIRGGRAESASRAAGGAAAWGLVVGAGLAHHLTSVLISIPLTAGLVAMLALRRRLWPRLPLAVGGALVPLASYGIIAWRAWHPARVQWAWLVPSLAGVVTHITGGQYRSFFGSFAPSASQRELLATAAYPFLFPGLALLVLGLLRAGDRDRRITWSALTAAAGSVTAFIFQYGVPDPAPYLLPALALGVAAAVPAIASVPGAGSRSGAFVLAAASLASGFVIAPWLRGGWEERTATIAFEKVIRSMWSAIPPDTAIVSWTDDRFDRLVEYQLLRGEKPALLIVTPDLLFAPAMRRTIRERFGVDPVEGFRPPRLPYRAPEEERKIIGESRQRLVRALNERVRVPVILFDPTVPIVWQMRKPWEPAEPPGPRSVPARPRPAHAPR
ncbi:MAG TPA: DUF2723 domain-containing protein [Candidatus Eisenbacteria bacterium]|jgi:hypothetical protein